MTNQENADEYQSLFDTIAKQVPEGLQTEYYRLLAHIKQLSPDDEILRIVQATGFLTLLTRQVPQEVAAEREKLDQLLLQDLPEALAREREELAAILSDSASKIQDAAAMTSQYHSELEDRLNRLPEEVAVGIAPQNIASRIGESLRQHLANTGIEPTVDALQKVGTDTQEAARQLRSAFDTIASDRDGVVPKMDKAVTAMTNDISRATNSIRDLSQRLYNQAHPWWPWGTAWVLLLLLLMLVIRWPSAGLSMINVDPATLVRLPENALKVPAMLREKNKKIDELEKQLRDLQRQMQGTSDLQPQPQQGNDTVPQQPPM
jgi:hypothetical protein